MKPARATARLAAALAYLPAAAWPHAFGERYDLPAPLAYFVAGAAATVGLSFVVAACATRGTARVPVSSGLIVAPGPLLPVLHGAGRALAVVLLALVVIAGLYGDPHPAKNLAPTLVWIIWWSGLSLVVACVGNVWPALDPWRAIFAAADALARRCGAANGIARGCNYPAALGAWPAVMLLLAFAWMEVIYLQSSVPSSIAWLAIAWSVLTLTGMACFGREVWQRNCDVFALYFATLGRFAPLGAGADAHSLVLRPPGRGLIAAGAVPAAMVAFVLAMLSTVLFDGLLGTQLWRLVSRAAAAWAPRLADREGYVDRKSVV